MPGSVLLMKMLLLAAALVGVGIIALAGTVLAMAMVLLRPERMGDAKALIYLKRLTPSDLGLQFEDVEFHVQDIPTGRMLRLAGWWIPAAKDSPAGRTAIVLHGYTDAKVGAIAWAPLLRSLGFNVLAIDLRAHGESEGKFTTAGFYERDDLSQVIHQVRQRWARESRFLLLYGISMGAAVVAAVASQSDDVNAVVLDCPYLDFPHAVLSHASRLGVPGRTFQKIALGLCGWIARVDYSKVRPVELIPRIRCPLLVIQACDDPFVPADDLAAIAKATKEQGGEAWQVESAYHILGMAAEPIEYRRRLEGFLSPLVATATAGDGVVVQ